MKIKKSMKLVLLMLIMTLGLTACGTKETPKEEAVEEKQVVLAGRRHLAPGEEDAYYCSSILYVWEPLVRQGENGEPEPALAESWEMSKDGKEWTFNLRKNVKFHDGEDFNADSVIANLDRMKKEVRQSSYYPMDIDSHYPDLKAYEKIDDNTIKLVFNEAKPTQLYRMVNFGSAIYSPKNFNEEGNFNGFAIGTGPFKIKENVKDDFVVIEKNEDYWGEKAKVEEIKIKNIPDVDTRYAALKAGEIHGTLDLDSLTPALAEELKKDDKFDLATAKSTIVKFLVLNGSKAPFDDVRLKQAVSMALDRQDIVDTVYFGYAEPTTNLLNYSTPFYKEIKVNENMEEAKKLANEVLKGERVSVDYYISGADVTQKTEAEMIAPLLAEIGIDVNIKPMEVSAMREEMKAGNYGIGRERQGLSNGEPSTIFGRFMLTSGDHNQNYSLGYSNEKVNELMEKASKESDVKKLGEIYDEIQLISTETLPVIPLFNDMNIMGHTKDLKNYKAQIYGLDLPNIEWAK